jgi:hypothetical protein
VETWAHFWNGAEAPTARRDIFLLVDGDRWYVEDRTGGAEGTSAWLHARDEDAAVEDVRRLMGRADGWREIRT